MLKGVAGVYTITCTATGRVYAGSSADIRERWYRHRYRLRSGQHHITALQLDWNEYGETAFVFQVVSESTDKAERHAGEQALIDQARAAGLCYNPAPRSDSARGYRFTPDQRAAVTAGIQGRVVSEETRRKISESNRLTWAGREITPEVRERLAAQGRKGKGRPKSEAHRRKLSESQKGRVFSPEHRANLSASLMGRTMSAETRQKIAAAGRGRPGYNTKITEDQAREVKRRALAGEKGVALAAEFGISPASVSQIKNGTSWRNLT